MGFSCWGVREIWVFQDLAFSRKSGHPFEPPSTLLVLSALHNRGRKIPPCNSGLPLDRQRELSSLLVLSALLCGWSFPTPTLKSLCMVSFSAVTVNGAPMSFGSSQGLDAGGSISLTAKIPGFDVGVCATPKGNTRPLLFSFHQS